MLGLLALAALNGCASNPYALAQRRAVAYQNAAGRIDRSFYTLAPVPEVAIPALRRAIDGFGALRPPGLLQSLNTALILDLRNELRSFVQAERDVEAPARLALDERLGRRARRAITRLLARIGRRVGACRNNRAVC